MNATHRPLLHLLRRPTLLGAVLLGACASSTRQDPVVPGPVAVVEVSPATDTVFLAGHAQLVAVAKDSDGTVLTGRTFTWQSSNGSVASVSTSGQVVGLVAGQVTISASTGGVSGGAAVLVQAAPAGSVVITPAADSVAGGSVLQLGAQVRDAGAQAIPGLTVTWTSANTAVATVTQAGFVTGVGNGTTGIIASYNGIADTATVKVRGAFTRADGTRVPLTDLGAATYQGFNGLLYPGANALPAAHLAAGIALANQVVPLDGSGAPSASGKVVLLSIGMSNATQEWCTKIAGDPCNSWSFTGQSQGVRRGTVKVVNGAHSSSTAEVWVSAAGSEYQRVRDSALTPAGVTEKQVQVVWLKLALMHPTSALPRADADAFQVLADGGQILRALRTRYPNLKLVFVASRIYAGYATVTLNPEPYAYEGGFAVKWLVDAQIQQMAAGGSIVNPVAGNLNYSTGAAPWVGWGPYLWANGTSARSDGLQWFLADLEADGTHPSDQGEAKVAGLLLDFFTTSPVARCWFISGATCP
ncbi:MAG: Ig-like domain-containing protein [Gemmatimonadales bacterium]